MSDTPLQNNGSSFNGTLATSHIGDQRPDGLWACSGCTGHAEMQSARWFVQGRAALTRESQQPKSAHVQREAAVHGQSGCALSHLGKGMWRVWAWRCSLSIPFL